MGTWRYAAQARCSECAYWEGVGESRELSASGFCRRNAPTVAVALVSRVNNAPEHDALWPHTLLDDWCGQYRPIRVEGEEMCLACMGLGSVTVADEG